MAFVIPENLRSRSDVQPGVNRTARVLQDAMDDETTVWFEPLFDVGGERPDLVVLIPDLGIMVMEILEKSSGTVIGARDHKLEVRTSGGVTLVGTPMSRAENFTASLRNAIDGDTRLTASEKLPVIAVSVMAYMTREDGERRHLGDAMDLKRTIFRDELEAATSNAEGFRKRIMQIMDGPLRDRLSDQAERVHRAIIHPDTVIGSAQLPFASLTPDDDIKVLDRRQESFAKGLGSGHRVIRGVAGSGKTLILTYRARLLAENFPQHKILVLCFNRSLAGILTRQLNFKNVQVRNIEGLMFKARKNAGLPDMEFNSTTTSQRGEAALTALDRLPGVVGRYDHVLIDEAQDFPTSVLNFSVRLLKPNADSLLVVADAAQNIYSNKFRWKDAGINALGRTRILDASYRNTREILDYANAFLMRGSGFTSDSSIDDETAIIPPKMSFRSGPLPLFLYLSTPQQEVLQIADRCKALLDDGFSPSSIGILYGSRNAGGFAWTTSLVSALDSRAVPTFWVTDPKNEKNKDHVGEDQSKVVLSTIHSAKGLEFSHVFLCGYLDSKAPETEELNRRLIYVGMTRATEVLVMTASGSHKFIADLDS